MKNKTLIITAGVCSLFVVGLIILSNLPTVGGSFGYGMARPAKVDNDDRVVVTDAPPQVVFRIDDHRFLTLENYIACDKSGQIYYNDTTRKIKTHLEVFSRNGYANDGSVIKNYYAGDDQIQLRNVQNGVMAYSGLLLYDAKGSVLVFPYVNNTWRGCDNNRGCDQGALVSIDNGKTFYIRDYERSTSSPTFRTVVTVGDNNYFVGNDYGYGVKIVPFIYGKTLTENVIEDRSVKFDKETLKNRMYDIRLHCDNSIKPSKVQFVKPEHGVSK